MTVKELGEKLKDVYTNAQKGEKIAMIHLFGITYSNEIIKNNYSKKEIIDTAGIPKSYGTELNRGIKLADYVVPKK